MRNDLITLFEECTDLMSLLQQKMEKLGVSLKVYEDIFRKQYEN